MGRKRLIFTYLTKYIDGVNTIVGIRISDSEGKKVGEFEYNKKAKLLKDIKKTKSANEKTILKYYNRQHFKKTGKKYKPTTEEEYNKKFNSFLDIHKNREYIKRVKTFKNENRIITTNRNVNLGFHYTYITVKVKIYLDGYYTYSFGQSPYKYNSKITNKELPTYINKAIDWALAPYGSNVKFDLIEWRYAFKQRKTNEFDKKVKIM